MEEKQFDYENYIQERLREIEDLDERRFAKKLLLENLGKIFQWTEEKYRALEQRVLDELEPSWKRFPVYMTIVEKAAYDPINSFWFPLCGEDVEAAEKRECKTIYLAADDGECKRFSGQDTIVGTVRKTGESICFRIERAAVYQEKLQKLYTLFSGNHIPWQTVNTGHVERFFNLVPVEAVQTETDLEISFGEWDRYIRWGMIPLWNIEGRDFHPVEYRIPCIDETMYEHILYLPEADGIEDGYLAETEEDILSIRYEENRILLRTREDTLGDVIIYRLHQNRQESDYGYRYPVLSNRRKDNLAARYLQQTGKFIQTPMELYRKIEEMSEGHRIDILGYGITDRVEGEVLLGDMDSFTGEQVFSQDRRNILLLRIRRGQQDDYLYESRIRYILTQLQMEFLEYRCMGMLV